MPSPTTDSTLQDLRDLHRHVPDPTDDTIAAARAALRQLIADDHATTAAPAAQHYAPAPKRLPRVRRRRFAVTGALAAVIAGAVIATTGMAGSGIDVVARAQAALTDGGPVVHLVTSGGWSRPDGALLQTGEVGPDGRRGSLSPRIESWATERPLRYLTKQKLVAPDGTVLGTRESGYATDGSGWETTPAGRVIAETPERTRATAIGGPEGLAASINNGLGADPTDKVRTLLSSGAFEDAGTTRVDGHDARRLIADQRTPNGSQQRTEYLIDADTFVPLQISTYTSSSGAPVDETTPSAPTQPAQSGLELSSRVTIELYERLPLNDRTTSLFQVPQNPDAGSAAHLNPK